MKNTPPPLLYYIVLSGLLSLNCFEAPPTGGFDAIPGGKWFAKIVEPMVYSPGGFEPPGE